MYNSALKGKGDKMPDIQEVSLPKNILLNDMTSTWMRQEFMICDCVYSEPSWGPGFLVFQERAGITCKGTWKEYVQNINKCVNQLAVPAFVMGGKSHGKYFDNATAYPITLMSDAKKICEMFVYVWNYHYDGSIRTNRQLLSRLYREIHTALDFSCGYGEHLLGFKDFVACDINAQCLYYLADKKRMRDCRG